MWRVLCIAATLGAAVLLVGQPAIPPTAAQPIDEIEQAEGLTRAVVAHINELINRNGGASLRNLARGVRFEVDRTTMPNAHAFWALGRRPTVVISAQMTLLLFYFSELALLNAKADGRLADCFTEYSSYVQRQYAELRTALIAGGIAAAIRSPERYAAQASIACSGLPDRYPLPLQDRPERDKQVANGVAFVYLHELGHHALGHVVEHEPALDRMPDELARRRAFLGYMCRSRSMERAADAFAADTLVDLGAADAVLSIALWSALIATGGIDPALEQIGTHPTGVVRQAFVLDRVRARVEAKGLPVRPEINALIDELLELVDKVQRQLPTMPLPDGSTYVCS